MFVFQFVDVWLLFAVLFYVMNYKHVASLAVTTLVFVPFSVFLNIFFFRLSYTRKISFSGMKSNDITL